MSAEKQYNRGQSYFLVGYYDRQFRFPYIQTFVFLGKNIGVLCSNAEEDVWCFQDPRGFLESNTGVSPDNHETDGIVFATKDTIDAYVDSNGLIKALATSHQPE